MSKIIEVEITVRIDDVSATLKQSQSSGNEAYDAITAEEVLVQLLPRFKRAVQGLVLSDVREMQGAPEGIMKRGLVPMQQPEGMQPPTNM